jgi:large conductance mechanosensitive channel
MLKGFKDFLSRGNVIDLPEQFLDFNAVLSAIINFLIVAAVVYFVIVLPYKKLRERGEVEQAQDTELSMLTEIRDLLAEQNGTAPKTTLPGTGPSPDSAKVTSAD